MKSLSVWWNIRRLRSPVPTVRARAIPRLVELADPAAIDPLCELLADEDRNLRAAAAKALGTLAHASAIDALVGALPEEKDWNVRYEIVEALRRIGDPVAVNELVLVLDSNDQDIRLRQFAARALREFGWEHLSPGQQATVAIIRDDWAGVSKLGYAAVDPLLHAIREGTHHVRRNAAETLAKLREPRALDALFRLLGDSSGELRQIAAEVLEKHAWTRLNETQLVRVAITLQKWSVLVGLGASAVEPLLGIIRTHDRGTQERAVRTLGEIGGPEAITALDGLLHEGDARVRRISAFALGETLDARAAASLIGALDDPDFEVREAAAAALSQIRWTPGDQSNRIRFAIARRDWSEVVSMGDVAVGPLIASLRHSSIRARALDSIVALGGRAIASLIEAMADPAFEIRQCAAEALGKIGARQAIEVLEGAVGDSELPVRRAAVLALEQLGWSPRDETHRAEICIALNQWDRLPRLGAAAIKPLMGAIDHDLTGEAALRTIEKMLQGEVAASIPVADLEALGAMLTAPTATRGMHGRGAPAAGKKLQGSVARRRIAQLARNEIRRRETVAAAQAGDKPKPPRRRPV